MRYQKLDLNLLAALKALLTERNVTRAGEQLHVTQSAMSGILSRLREYFDDPLIVQVGRKMELTPLAESLLVPVSDILLRINTTIATRPSFTPATAERHFSLVASDYTTSVLLIDVLRRVHNEAPGISVELRTPSDAAAFELESGDVDFIIHPQHQSSTSQPGEVLFEDTYTIVVDANHPHAGSTMSLDEYLSWSHVGFKSGSTGLSMYENWFLQTHGDARRIEVYNHNFHLMPHLVVGTTRLATMHTRLAEKYIGQLPVRLITPGFDTPRLVELLQWHKYRDMDPGSIWLRQCIVDAARELHSI
ncbi:LysR family transcriptional regulator [Dyella sp. C9]|uniref:LysR family transcriptional regulator n=1 Tax=Dyella sp. C9 TaxID=2202154 RepID=UPI0018E52CAB|nr:LysR family transcriptional regulator [Dyella sp. C9]